MNKQIAENNKLIAEFMGYIDNGCSEDGFLINPITNYDEDISELKYEVSWERLMVVVEKILDTCSETDDMESYYTVVDAIPNITSTHRTVVEFINCYNSNK